MRARAETDRPCNPAARYRLEDPSEVELVLKERRLSLLAFAFLVQQSRIKVFAA
jgi:hypothetical protein